MLFSTLNVPYLPITYNKQILQLTLPNTYLTSNGFDGGIWLVMEMAMEM